VNLENLTMDLWYNHYKADTTYSKINLDYCRNCIESVEKTREDIRLWKKEIERLNPKNKKFEESLPSTKVETFSDEATNASSSHHRIMFPRILKKNAVRPSPISETIEKNIQNIAGNMCYQCNHIQCQCSWKSKEKVLISTTNCLADPFVHFAMNTGSKFNPKPLNSTEITEFTSDIEPESSKLRSTTPEVHLLTLELRQVLISGDEPNEGTCKISEREVQKVLQRVPSIIALKNMRRDRHNAWVVEVESRTNRVANIRFSCKGKSYVIGMFS